MLFANTELKQAALHQFSAHFTGVLLEISCVYTIAIAKRQTHYFAPGCPSGYVSARKEEKKASVLAIPDDDEHCKVAFRELTSSTKRLPWSAEPISTSDLLFVATRM